MKERLYDPVKERNNQETDELLKHEDVVRSPRAHRRPAYAEQNLESTGCTVGRWEVIRDDNFQEKIDAGDLGSRGMQC